MTVQGPWPDTKTAESFLSLSAGGRIVDILFGSATIDFGSVAANAAADSDITVTGARPNDFVLASPPGTPDAEMVYIGFVESNNTVTVRACNQSTGAVNPASGTYKVLVFKLDEGI